MFSLSKRLKFARLTIGDQADYLQQLIDQFDMPYDVCCTMQMIADDLRVVAQRMKSTTVRMPKCRKSPPGKRAPGKRGS